MSRDMNKRRIWAKKYMAVYYLEHKDALKAQRMAYYYANKDKASEYQRRKKTKDVQYKLAAALRSRLHKALKKNFKNGSAVTNLGCSIPELKMYLEGQFKDGMTWENWSHGGWHIDHKIPLVFFDLANKEQLLKAVHYTNLQPMWAKENFSKNKRLISYV